MASIKNLKQDLNNAIGEIIEGSMLQQIVGDEKNNKKADELVDESIAFFDEMISEINKKTDKKPISRDDLFKEYFFIYCFFWLVFFN